MNSSTVVQTDISENLCKKDLIKGSLYTAMQRSYAIACWSCPESKSWDIILDPEPLELAENKTPYLYKLPSGFLIAPFKSNAAKYFIQKKIHIQVGETVNSEAQPEYSMILEDVFQTSSQTKGLSLADLLPEKTIQNTSTDHDYIAGVEAAKKVIIETELQKVVLARSKEQPISLADLETVVLNLRKQYPLAYVAIFFHPETGLWISATPELLLATDSDGTFKTVALAGTQKYNPDIPIRDVSWTHKEIEEQALVGRYIINCFKTIRLREYIEEGPRTIQSGNLLHLKTVYTANTTEVNMQELGTTMLQLLHPTSAVCGMPKKPATEFIEQYEHFDRNLFSGYSGPVNMDRETALYVTLRCAQIHSNSITLYAGAGITAYSVAQKEFDETNLKMDVIGKAFSNL
ncbi:chorismate-binding protein [Cytophaga aurantiaca]|uniref:chorismate-binding protein n=1 Tax=Cytophaga aurantiaca TaxID=29530 RepID=UPI00036B91BD|nr:chorismate-binding protein [Cytophaga aurantiaca]